MVKSGLDPSKNSDLVPRVSQYRLAAHLTSAFVLYAVLLRAGLIHLFPTFDVSKVSYHSGYLSHLGVELDRVV